MRVILFILQLLILGAGGIALLVSIVQPTTGFLDIALTPGLVGFLLALSLIEIAFLCGPLRLRAFALMF